jgi:hypothetical protein
LQGLGSRFQKQIVSKSIPWRISLLGMLYVMVRCAAWL